MRILITSHASMNPELGASQIALNLAEALQKRGHDIILWAPPSSPSQMKWWASLSWMRRNLEQFIEREARFDVLDCPALFVTPRIRKSVSTIIARSVQPEILYLLEDLKAQIKENKKNILRIIPSSIYILFLIPFFLLGWSRANHILCLGSHQFQWMKKWFPWWQKKLSYYVGALSEADQQKLAEVRTNREAPESNRTRFLWIGRWSAHKGTKQLIDFINVRALKCPLDTFTISGCGYEAEKDCPSELLRSEKLKIIPAFRRNELYSLLANHDVGLFTSKIEGWGLVLNEMLESGMSVFATPVGGVPDLKPFFKETLKSFPSPLNIIPANSITSITLRGYYKIFSWKKIAETYAALIFPKHYSSEGNPKNDEKNYSPRKLA